MPCRPLPQPLRAAASSICRVWLPCRTGKVSTTKASAGRRRPLGTAERRAVRILHLLDHSLPLDRKSVVLGKGVSVRVDLGGRRIIKKKRKKQRIEIDTYRKKRYKGK